MWAWSGLKAPKMRRVVPLEINERNRKNVTGVQLTIFVKWGYENKLKLTLFFSLWREKC